MNYIKHLTGFFDRVIQDRNLNPTHISLYMAIFHAWNINRFKNPISITRDEMMLISQISSKATYHKCMRELNDKKYIKYEPSFNPYKGSLVTLHSFLEDVQPVQKKDNNLKKILATNEQVLNKQEATTQKSTETATEQALVSSINYINNKNILNNENISNLNEQSKNVIAKNEAISINNYSDKIVIPSEVEGTKKQKKLREKNKVFTEPNLVTVKEYFVKQNFPELEAQKFFNYFSSIGWLVGGKTPMTNWQAAAQNWILNSTNFNNNTDTTPTNRPKHLNTTTDKNYAEPL